MNRPIFLHVTSKDSHEYFPNNSSQMFILKLNKPLNLTGLWKIGLCEIFIEGVFSELMSLTCNICQGVILDGKQSRVLRTLKVYDGNYDEIYPIVFYVPIETRFVDTIEFCLVQTDGTPVLLKGESHVSMTLHLKPC
jgi:hypothetical protein